MHNTLLEELSKEELIELIDVYSKNWLAMDGFWFQSVERKYGMDEAMYHDIEAWKRYTVTEARRIKKFLRLPDNSGLEGLAKALRFRFDGNLNDNTCTFEGNRLIYRNLDCMVQTARKRKGLPYHPCKAVAVWEYSGFASVIDDRIKCRCISCYPDCTESETGCAWEFSIDDE